MTRIGLKLFMTVLAIGVVALVSAGCPAQEASKSERPEAGADSPTFAEASESAERPFREEFLSVDLGISRDVIEREDALGPPTVSEGGRAIYTESDDVGDKTIDELIDEAIAEDSTYLMTYYVQGQLNQISREWYQGGEDGFTNSEHRSLVAGFAGLTEEELSEDDSRVVGLHNALRDELDTDGAMGELSSDGIQDLLGDWDMLTAIGDPGSGLNEFLFFEEDPDRDLSNLNAGDAITQLASEGNRSTLTVRVEDGQVVGSLVGHIIGGTVNLGGSDSGVVYSRFFWSKADVVGDRP